MKNGGAPSFIDGCMLNQSTKYMDFLLNAFSSYQKTSLHPSFPKKSFPPMHLPFLTSELQSEIGVGMSLSKPATGMLGDECFMTMLHEPLNMLIAGVHFAFLSTRRQ